MPQHPHIGFKFDYNLLAKILAMFVLLEGGVIAVNARRVVLEGIGGIRASYVQLAGIQLLVLGLIALIVLILPNIYYKGKKLVSLVIGQIPTLVALVIIVEALAVAYFATPLHITDVGHVRIFWMAGFAAQLFFIGTTLLSSRVLAGKENLGLNIIAAMVLIISSIGVLVVGIAARAVIEGFGSFGETMVFIGGIRLLLVPAVMMFLLFLGDRKFLSGEVFGLTLSTLGIVVFSVITSIEGLIVVSYAANTTVQELGLLSERTILLFGLVIAFLGMAIPATIFSKVKSNKKVQDLAKYSVVFLVLLFPFALFV